MGRWLSRDPIGEKGGYNLYAMVLNNPVYDWDELGLQGNTSKGTCICKSVDLFFIPKDGKIGLYDNPDLVGQTLGVRIGVKWTVEGTNSSCCVYEQNEKGSITVSHATKNLKTGKQFWKVLARTNGKNNIVSQSYTDFLGHDLVGFIPPIKILVQVNVDITFKCTGTDGGVVTKNKIIKGHKAVNIKAAKPKKKQLK